jgi:peptide deformylase
MENKIIYKIGNPKLREKSELVTDFSTLDMFLIPMMERGIQEMCDQGVRAAGISAIQVGVTKQVFIITQEFSHKVVCNPKILSYGKNSTSMLEGCLSVDDEFYDITRPDKVKVEYQDKTGKTIKETIKGFEARVFQHELDHLHGIMMPDRVLFDDALIDACINHDNDRIVEIELDRKEVNDEFAVHWTTQVLKKYGLENNTGQISVRRIKEISDRNLAIKKIRLKAITDEVQISDD